MDKEMKEFLEDEIRAEAMSSYEEGLRNEFNDTYTDYEIAQRMIDNGDTGLSFEEIKEILFEEYCELRD